MHFEVPKLPHSVKEFSAHYVMIVVSILTALGLEAAVEKMHHRHAAEKAQEALESELRTNLADLRSSNANNARRLKPLEDFTALLIKDFDDGVPAAQIKQQMVDRVKAGIDFGVFYPKLRHEAWDVAVANQSASFIEPETLRRLSVAYSSQREINPASLTPFVNLPGFINAMTDARVGTADPHEFLRAMRQASLTVSGANQKLMELEVDLAAALPDEQAALQPAAVKASAASAH